MSQSYEYIEVDVEDGVAVLTFNRPEVRNALHLPMNLEVRNALATLGTREDVGALILQGAGGKAFVSGADIAELRDRKGPEALLQHNAKLCDDIERFPYPTIAAIEGWALGGGCEIALACDMRVLGESAKMGQPEVSLGILPAAGGTWRLPRIVGLAKAKELIFTAAIVDAWTCAEIGLANHVTGAGSALERAKVLAKDCAKQSRLAVRLAKIAINEGRQSGAATGRALEALGQSVLYDDAEKMKRMTAFLERKEARKKKE